MQFAGRCLLLDIEGTTSSIRFVFDEMFPYVRRNLQAFLDEQWDQPSLRDACRQMAVDQGAADPEVSAWTGSSDPTVQKQVVIQHVNALMDQDSKTTGLKQLQGLIWRDGFHAGQLRAHVYEEVPDCLNDWREQGCDLRIYSSGSVAAQLLFFGHTIAGDLLHHFQGHYDTRIGAKKESRSYINIAEDIGIPTSEILFVSDVVAELDAARETKMQTALSIRPGNPEMDPGTHPTIHSFREIEIQ